jgi:hypothetical protein
MHDGHDGRDVRAGERDHVEAGRDDRVCVLGKCVRARGGRIVDGADRQDVSVHREGPRRSALSAPACGH